MRFLPLPILLATLLSAYAQSEIPPEVTRAKAGIERLRSLVGAGVEPEAKLVAAEAELADVEDEALLRRTAYGSDLTEDQADEMLAAANRRIERRKTAVDDARKRIDSGAASLLSLTPLLEDLDRARRELDVAESRARLTSELARMAQAEELMAAQLANNSQSAQILADRYDGDGVFSMGLFSLVDSDFQRKFGKPLPVSAMGETAVHRSLGFDHRGRVDVALHPDQPEGHWLLEYLVGKHIPYFAFRQAVPGKATGAHIHIGPISTRVRLGG